MQLFHASVFLKYKIVLCFFKLKANHFGYGRGNKDMKLALFSRVVVGTVKITLSLAFLLIHRPQKSG